MKPRRASASDRPQLVRPVSPLALGDMLQRLATIAPDDLSAIKRLVRDVLRQAEARHRRYFRPKE